MRKSWVLILGRINGNKSLFFTMRETFYENHYTNEHSLLVDAYAFAKEGVCVILRPLFNDNDAGDFHEWRSFNGEPMRRVEFGSPLKDPSRPTT